VKVTLTVDAREPLGDMEITRRDQLDGLAFNEPELRSKLADLLAAAVVRTCGAYEIEPVAVTSRIEEAQRLRDPLTDGTRG
jgi:hypothetical protein